MNQNCHESKFTMKQKLSQVVDVVCDEFLFVFMTNILFSLLTYLTKRHKTNKLMMIMTFVMRFLSHKATCVVVLANELFAECFFFWENRCVIIEIEFFEFFKRSWMKKHTK